MGAQAFQGTQPYLNTAIGSATSAAGGGLLNPQQDQYLNQYADAASRQMNQQYRNVTAPNILANAAETGGVGGSGEKAAFNAANSQLATGEADLLANIYEPAYATNLQATENAISGAPSLAQGAYIPAQMIQQQAGVPYQSLNQLGTGLNAGAGTGTEVQRTTGGGGFK